MLIAFSAPPPQNAPVVLTMLFYNGPEATGKEFFADLFALGPIANMTAMMPYAQLNSQLNHAAGFDGRKQFGGGAFKLPLDAEFVVGLHEEFNAFVSKHERVGESMMLWEVIPYHKIMGVKNGEMAFANRGDYYNLAVQLKWLVFLPHPLYYFTFLSLHHSDNVCRYDSALDDEIRSFSRSLLKKASETAAKTSKDDGVGQYGNYATADVEANDIFGENVKKLEDLKHKYDPQNLFSHGTRLTPRPLVVVN
jgi:FAD/FMN-containing dehydrogenase